jgi:hypothetical protein
MYFTYFGQSSKPGNRLQSCARDLLEAIDHPASSSFNNVLKRSMSKTTMQTTLRADFWDSDAIGISLDWFTAVSG